MFDISWCLPDGFTYTASLQTELVHDRLRGHAKHLLKFGKDSYDQLQYDAVVANTNQALLINAGKA